MFCKSAERNYYKTHKDFLRFYVPLFSVRTPWPVVPRHKFEWAVKIIDCCQQFQFPKHLRHPYDPIMLTNC